MTDIEKITAAYKSGALNFEQIASASGDFAADWEDFEEFIDCLGERAAADIVSDLLEQPEYVSPQRAQIERLYRCGKISRATYLARIKFN